MLDILVYLGYDKLPTLILIITYSVDCADKCEERSQQSKILSQLHAAVIITPIHYLL
jgi:hypothetical protein